jgi:hypothetical protein
LVALEKRKLGVLTYKILIMNVIYYYYFIFYSKVLKDDEPHLLTTMALSASQGFILNSILQILFIRFFCIEINIWTMFCVIILFNVFNYFYFHRGNRIKKIVKEKPMFFSSNKISIAITILFFIIVISSMFLGPIYSKYILETYCNK